MKELVEQLESELKKHISTLSKDISYPKYVQSIVGFTSDHAKVLREGHPRSFRVNLNKKIQRINSQYIKQRGFLYFKSPACGICGKLIKSLSEATIDHIIPTSLGGVNNIVNKQIAHQPCNAKKGNKLDE